MSMHEALYTKYILKSLKGIFRVPVRLSPPSPSRSASTRPYIFEHERRSDGGHPAPSLSRPGLYRRRRARHHMFREVVDDIPSELLVRRARATPSVLAGAWASCGDIL